MTESGHLYGVGLGPGDSGLVTVAAAKIIGSADVVAFHAGTHGHSTARGIAAPYLASDNPDQIEELLTYPVTTGVADHAGGYAGALGEFYASATARLAHHLDQGRSVAVLSLGDPMLYSSYQHLHRALADRYPTTVIPGVTSITAAAASVGRPLVEKDETLGVIPGTLSEDELVKRLSQSDGAVVMKLGRTFPTVRRALVRAGQADRAYVVVRATMEGEQVIPLLEVDPAAVPYFAVAVVPSPTDSELRRSTEGSVERSK